MRIIILALLICMASGPLHGQEGPRALSPAPKGVELYSWRECASCTWHFALLPGTNRLKTLGEIKEPTHIILEMTQLKKHLSHLPKGESVFWISRLPSGLSLPEPGTIAQLVGFSAEHNVTLRVAR